LEAVAVYRQERIKKKLERDLEQGRLAPSLIFHGLPGVGKERMAFYLAQSILCRESGRGACGECLSCRKVSKLLHPDVQWLFPKPGSVDDDELEKIIDRKSRKDFYKPAFGKTSSHAIDAIRRLRIISSKRPYEGNSKVFIVTEGDRMTVEASNAFLKLLEEPPDDTVILMTTSRLHALLPTIRSRCEEIRFSPIPLDELKKILVEDLEISAEIADQLSRFSEGSLGRVVMARQQVGKDGWDDAWQIFQLASLGSEGDIFEYVTTGPLKGDREKIRLALEVLISLLRDLLAVTLDLGKDDLINVSRYDLFKDCGELKLNGVIRSIKLVEEQRRLLDRNINSSILLWHLLHNMSLNLKAV
jgi:DNA polymerase-3 subunit delta'